MQGKSGIRPQGCFTNRFPFCSLILFHRALIGGIGNSLVPAHPWQVDTTSLNPGKAITLTPSATAWMVFPWRNLLKGQRVTALFPLHPTVLLSKATHSCQASCCCCRRVMAVVGAFRWVPHLQGLGERLNFTLYISELASECRKKPGT